MFTLHILKKNRFHLPKLIQFLLNRQKKYDHDKRP